jgi:hypothetical protein
MPEKTECETWNVPDWHDVNEYGYVNQLTPHQVRWEFLRRIPAYRQAYENRAWHYEYDYGLQFMLDPNIRGDHPSVEIKFIDTDLGGTLFDPKLHQKQHDSDMPSPDMLRLAKQSGKYAWYSEKDIDNAIKNVLMPSYPELVGQAVIDLMERGYSLFVFDPHTEVQSQTKFVARQLDKLRKKRTNAPREAFRTIASLRSMDAFNEVNARENKKWLNGEITKAAKKIFKDLMNEENITNKTLMDAYEQGQERAFRTMHYKDVWTSPAFVDKHQLPN